MSKTEKIRKIYTAITGLCTVALGIAFICVTADIYYSGRGTAVIFSRETAAEKLTALAIPFAVLVAAVICGAVAFPICDAKAKVSSEYALKLLSAKKPSGGEGEIYESALKKYGRYKKMRYIAWAAALAVSLACASVALCYLLNTSHFTGEDFTAEIFGMVRFVLPFIAAATAALIAAAVLGGAWAKKQLAQLKILIKHGNSVPEEKARYAAVEAVKRLTESKLALWIVRGAVFAAAVTFIILGVFNGGARDVWIKAVNICTECIGLG